MTKTLIGVASSLDFWGREWRGQGNSYWTLYDVLDVEEPKKK
jgi:hypothetical protein